MAEKTIWIINQYASLSASGANGRHRHLARELAARGHKVAVIAASWTHLSSDADGTAAPPEVEATEGVRYVRIPTRRYRHAHDKRRILNWLLFAWRIRRLPRILDEAPDVVLYSSPSLIGFLGAEHLADLYGAQLVLEVRDIWPLTLVEVGGYSERHPFIRLLQHVEDRAYRRADRVVSNLPGAVEHMVQRGMERGKFAWVPNGISLSEVEATEPLAIDVERLIPAGRFIIGYAGTVGVANALDGLIEAADRLRAEPGIAVLIVGEGGAKAGLQAEVRKRDLTNVHFIGAIPKQQVQSILQHFDACFIAWKDSPLYEFGIAANKLYDYLYSAKPILHCYSGAHDPVRAYGAGISVRAEDPIALAEAILRLRDMLQEDRAAIGARGRRAVIEHHEYRMLAQKLESALGPDAVAPP